MWTEEELTQKKRKDLQTLCKELGLSAGGKVFHAFDHQNTDLIQRILEQEQQDGASKNGHEEKREESADNLEFEITKVASPKKSPSPKKKQVKASRRGRSRSPKRAAASKVDEDVPAIEEPESVVAETKAAVENEPSPVASKSKGNQPSPSRRRTKSPQPADNPVEQADSIVPSLDLDKTLEEPVLKLDDSSLMVNVSSLEKEEQSVASALGPVPVLTSAPVPAPSKITSPRNRLAEIKSERAASSLEKLADRRAAKAFVNTNKTAPINCIRSPRKSDLRSPRKKVPDFDKIHSNNFNKLASIGEKPASTPASERPTSIPVPRPVGAFASSLVAQSPAHLSLSSSAKPSPASTFKPGITRNPGLPALRQPSTVIKPTKASVMAAAAAEARKSEKPQRLNQAALTAALAGAAPAPAPSTISSSADQENQKPATTAGKPAVSKTAKPARPQFDLKASLERPLTWKTHTGRVPTKL